MELMRAGATVPGDEWDILVVMSSFWFQVYRLAVLALAPLALRRLATPVGRRGERRGHVPERSGELWLHAASVGEFNAAVGLIERLLKIRPGLHIVVSTITQTAAEEVQRRFVSQAGNGAGSRLRHVFAPLDTPRAVHRWLTRTAPVALVLVETELWPEMLTQCKLRDIPVAMVNARLSDRALKRYMRLGGLFRDLVSEIDLVLAQDDVARKNFKRLCVPDERLFVTGNLKHEPARLPEVSPEVCNWQRLWEGRPAWLAGSTHAGEETLLARAQLRILEQHPDALLVVVPRHPERASRAMQALIAGGVNACDIEHWTENSEASAVVIGRMGVLGMLYRCIPVCLVGGSLVPGIGGHNLIEPALASRPVLVGAWVDAQRESAEGLERAGALFRVADAASLSDAVRAWMTEPADAVEAGKRAQAWAQSRKGSLAASLERMLPWLNHQGL